MQQNKTNMEDIAISTHQVSQVNVEVFSAG